MAVNLYEYQKEAIEMLKPGSILCGGVGSGKSITALAYYFTKECAGQINPYSKMKTPKDLYIITTARKRDTLEWEKECSYFLLSTNQKLCVCDVRVIVDSWNNIKKYKNIENAFFIFDEQRLVGSGVWVKTFLKIVKKNNWILLSATPGDTWMDYVPVFLANGFYKNRTEFIRQHVVYNSRTKFPKVDRYIEERKLKRLKNKIIVLMNYVKPTISNSETIIVPYDKDKFNIVAKKRWNVFAEKPIKNISELCYLMRRVVNEDLNRLEVIKKLLVKHPKLIIFYTFNYELEMLRDFCKKNNIPKGEWNGHVHELIPNEDKWAYLVQYTAGAEGWNCVETNCIVFFSQHYSYRITTQAAGRIDRLNTKFSNLYYYHIRSNSAIDLAIDKALKAKRKFNETLFIKGFKRSR